MDKAPPNHIGESSPFSEMSNHELDRFLVFIDTFHTETKQCLSAVSPIREMDIILTLMRSHLKGRLETPSSLGAASGHPRGTAHRMIESLIENGLILRRPRTKTGKTFSLHPSQKMIREFMDYTRRMKQVIGSTFGMPEGTDFFFGASYLSASVIAPLPVQPKKLSLSSPLRLLFHADPTFLTMNNLKQQLEMHFGTEINAHAMNIDGLRREILNNAKRKISRYDIITSDLCWMAELIDRKVVQSIGEFNSPDLQNTADFHPEALATVMRDNRLFGLPVQTTPELLIYRTDLFGERDLNPPTTIEEMLELAKQLHKSEKDLNGICWNGARGTPLGTTFMMLMADFGQPVINLPRRGNSFIDQDLKAENYRPTLDSPEALQVAELLMELREVSPANVLQMSWYERVQCYAKGEAAMAYCYTQIMRTFINNPDSPAYGATGYSLHPSAAGKPQIAPLGGWNLCIPANLRENRIGAANTAIRTLTSAAATKLYIENGSMVSSRFSVCNDPVVVHNRPIIPIVDRMARAGQLQAWPRPAVAELSLLVQIIGDEIHSMLLRNTTPQNALRNAQTRCDQLMRENGRY